MTARAARFGAAMAMLWAAHDLADHVVQTDHQAAGKSTDWRCMAGHIATYHATQAAALAAIRWLGVRPSWRRYLGAMAVSAVTHWVLDLRWPVVALLRATGSGRFANPVVKVSDDPDVRVDLYPGQQAGPLPLHGPYLADQALHHAALTVCALILAGGDLA